MNLPLLDIMTTKSQLQSKIQELEQQLTEFKYQLSNYQEITLDIAKVGDVLEDGSIVLQKENGLALLVAPISTQVSCKWSPEFPDVYAKLKEQGFNPSQWFVPTKEQLQLAYERILGEFCPAYYWSSTERDSSGAWFVYFTTGYTNHLNKTRTNLVRTFRCVTY